jgi:hypothetical protein
LSRPVVGLSTNNLNQNPLRWLPHEEDNMPKYQHFIPILSEQDSTDQIAISPKYLHDGANFVVKKLFSTALKSLKIHTSSISVDNGEIAPKRNWPFQSSSRIKSRHVIKGPAKFAIELPQSTIMCKLFALKSEKKKMNLSNACLIGEIFY